MDYWKGKKLSEEHRAKLRTAKIGKKASEETKRKMSEAHKGHTNGGWKLSDETRKKFSEIQKRRFPGNGASKEQELRKTVEYRLWREAVFKRDDFTCQQCGERGGRVNADHIKPFCLFPELRFDISNGRTLCEPCHRKIGWQFFRELNPKKKRL